MDLSLLFTEATVLFLSFRYKSFLQFNNDVLYGYEMSHCITETQLSVETVAVYVVYVKVGKVLILV